MGENPAIRYGLRRYPIAIAVLLLTVFIHLPCSAGQVLTIDSDRQYGFADSFFTNGEYSRAIDEYKRFIYFFPDDDRTDSARYKIGISYMKSNRFELAIAALKVLIDRLPHGSLFVQSHWRISECYVKLRKFGPAVTTLENLIARVTDKEIQDQSYYRIGWIYIETASFEKARLYFSKISDENKNKFNIDKLFSALDKKPFLPQKSPGLAGTLSLLPGAGYLYCGRYRDALIALVVNGAVIAATYAAFDNDNPVLGGVLGFIGLGFYTANIYGATTSAHKYNKAQTRNFIEKLKQNTKIQLSVDYRKRGFLFSFRYDF